MQLKRFSVKGFKNFRQEVVLENMGNICVIHGENNVGKSNVFDAMRLFFLFKDYSDLEEQINLENQLEYFLEENAFKISEIFTFGLNELIDMSVTLRDEKDINVTLNISISNVPDDDSGFRVDITNNSENDIQTSCFDNFISKQFALIGVNRQTSDIETEIERCIVPQSLLLRLHDMKDSPEPAVFDKWELFVSTLQKFSDILGEGKFVSVFDRESNRANLMFQPKIKPRRRIPIEILGSGIQQIVALIARLLVSDEDFIAIEEPELNLRYTLQLRLREILDEIVKAPVGPQQIFLTSHSPAFEFGEHFYAMKATDDGPIIENLPIKQAHLFTEHNAINSNLGETVPEC
ncbi:AAA family ATPase [Candidatus Parabeggiatoa sp. HSG14]|uniref:AAA family ATPase n=1 Tax=Candidatus Parabeggiatoa sp. HSG14 TaxID=3055593 RepID=UPI0025A719A2|nr:AAA family ATPase [Thiotrichales bacterium HSG14]